jgi:uncharacterized membrane protein
MTLLITGVLLWSFVHLVPAAAGPLKQAMTSRLGEKGYKAVFSLLILGGLVLIVLGWRSTPEEYLYVLPAWSRTLGFVLMIVAFLLLGATHHPTRIKRFIRHPMLTGVFVWSASHLLMNGTTRALILLGGLGLWALLEIVLINRREGLYIKPDAPALGEELKGFFISGIIFGIVLFLHPYFAGVAAFPR